VTPVGASVVALLPPALLLLATGYALAVAVRRPARRGSGISQVNRADHEVTGGAVPEDGKRASGRWAGRGRALRVALLSLAVPLALAGACCGLLAATSLGRTEVYEIPAGYRGWLVVRYEDRACAPFRTAGTRRYIRFDAAGRACTSEQNSRRWRRVEFVYVSPDGGRVAIPTAPAGFTAGAAARSTPPPGVHADLFGGSGDGKESTAFVAAAPEDLPLLQYTNPIAEADTRAKAIQVAGEAARARGVSDPKVEGVELGTLGQQRGAMSPEWNAALGAFIDERPERSTGYYRIDADTPTWLVRVSSLPSATPADEASSGQTVLLVLVDARTGRQIGSVDRRTVPVVTPTRWLPAGSHREVTSPAYMTQGWS
jgi:hypothetical protein